MANDTFYKRSQGSVWIQPDGPASAFLYLNCAGLDGFSQPEGDITLLYCKDPARAGKFKVRDSIQGEPGPVTTSLNIPFGKVNNYVMSLKCPFDLQVRYATCDRADDPNNWEKFLHFKGVRVTQRSSDGLAARTNGEEGEILTTAALSAETMYEGNSISVERQSTVETNSINDIAFDAEQRCDSSCGAASAGCQEGYASCDRTGATTANVLRTANGGGAWAATAADPFAVSEDISGVVFDGDRVIVARLTTDAGNPAEIGYSDDDGATWTNVNVGSTNAQTLQRLHWFSRPYLWAVANSGYIYFSDDAGLSWTTQDAGVATVQTLNDIDFASPYVGFAVGNANAVVKTTDGGATWVAVTGPAGGVVLNCVEVVDENTVWVGTAGGEAWYTNDAGVTWTESTSFSGSGVGQVRDIRFYTPNLGFMLKNSAGPVGTLLRTIDGGESWDSLTTPTNAGLNRMFLCDQNNVFAVGEASGGTGVILNAA